MAHPNPDPNELLAELRRLRDAQKQDRTIAAVAVFLAVAALALGPVFRRPIQAEPKPLDQPAITTRVLTLVTEEGTPRMQMTAQAHGASIQAFGPSGAICAALNASDAGSFLTLAGGRASFVVQVGTKDSSIALSDGQGRKRVVVFGGESPSVSLLRPDGKADIHLGMDGSGPHLKLTDGQTGKVLFERP